MGYSRDKLEENRKKKKALEQAFKQSNFQQTAQKLNNAAQSAKPKTNTTTKNAAKSSGGGTKTNTVTQSAPKQQTGLSSFQKLGNVAKTVQSVGQKVVQNANDMRNLQRNSIMWHGTTDTAKRESLQQQNDAIRQRLGLSFDPSTGVTFDSKTGKNYSLPTQMLYGTSAGQRASTAGKFATSSTVLGQKSETQRGIDAHKTMADLYSRSAETWSDNDTSKRDNARQALADEMQNIMRQYGLQYSARSTGPNARFTVSDNDAIEKLRAAGADETTLAYVAENIQMREAADRLGQGVEAVWKRAVAAFPALVETSDQRRENLEKSRENPEYVKLEQEQQRLNAQLQEMQKKGQDVSSVVEYMKVYNELQEVIKQKDALAVKTPVDQNKWGQTMLREAAEAQANATAGLADVPRFLANTGISIAGNAPTMALSAIPGAGPVAGMALMGASAAGQRAAELNAQGVSPDEALGRGLTSGIIEAVTEKLPLDEMAKLLKGGGTSAVRNILRQMGIEAGEESASYLMNYAADLAANDPNAEFSFAELAQSALGGMVSGGVFGTAGTVIGGTRTQQGPTVGIPESMNVQEADAGARMAQEAMQTAQGETLLPRTEIIQEGSSPRGIESNPYMGIPVKMLQNRLGQLQTRYWGADAETQQAMLEDMSRLSEAIDSADQQAANSQALGRRLAELDAEKRQAETLLPGPIRDRAIQQAEEAMQRVQQEAAAKTTAPAAQAGTTEQTAPNVQVPADAAFQYGLSPEAAMLEAQERARNQAVQEQAEQERADTVSELMQAWTDKRAAEKQAEQTLSGLTLTQHDIDMAQNAARTGVNSQEWAEADNPENARLYGSVLRQVREADKPIRQYFAERADEMQTDAQKAADAIATYAKDKRFGGLYQRETMERNIRDIFGKEHQAEAESIIREYITPVHKAVAQGNRLKNKLRDRVKALKLNKHESALTQMRLEKEDAAAAEYIQNNKINLTPEMDAKISRAVEEFRSIYNELYNAINRTLLLTGQEPAPFRQNYAPHFVKDTPDTLLGKVRFALGLGKDSSVNIPTDIAGLTDTFRPGKKWFGNLLQREGEITDYDAVAGFDRYVETAADVITLTDSIQKLRALEDQVRYTLSDEGVKAQIDKIKADANLDALSQREQIEKVYDDNRTTVQKLIADIQNQKRMGMGRFVTELRRYTDNLAGKKSREDRGWEDFANRQVYTLAKNLEGRVAANMISLNPGSWLTNFIPITQASGEVSVPNLLRGMYQTVKSGIQDDGYVDASTFLTNRYGSQQLDRTLTRKVSDISGAPMELIDHFTANTIHRGRYNQNIAKGMSVSDAIDDADAFTASLMADRSKGAVPTVFNATNPVRKVFTMFQTEVNNQLSYLFKDMPKAQRQKGVAAVAWAYTKVFAGAYFYNLLYSQLTGRDSALDPIGMIADALGLGDDEDEEKTAAERVTGLVEDIGGQIPFIGGILFDGGRVPISSAIPNFANLGKAAIPGLFGVEWSGEKRLQTAAKELAKPATYLLPPFGGGAAKKAIEGFATVKAGGSYAYDNQGNLQLQFPAYGQSPMDYAKTMLFGKWSSDEAQQYIDSGFKGLSADETSAYDNLRDNMGVNPRDAMEAILSIRGFESVKDAEGNTVQTVKEQQRMALFDNEKLTPEQKAAIDSALIVSGEDEMPADYTDRNSFVLGQYINENRQDAARAALESGLTVDQFVQWDDRLSEVKGTKDRFDKNQYSADEARGIVLDEVMKDSALSDSEKQAIADYVLISSMSDTQQEKWSIAKGKVNASDFVRFKDDVAAYEEEFSKTGADNAGNVATILRGYQGLTDEQRDVLYQTYSDNMSKNPFHVSVYEKNLSGNSFYSDLNDAGKAELRSLANEYEQAVEEGKELNDWQGKAYMAKEAGIAPETYILYRVALAATNEDGKESAKQSEAETAVNLLPGLTQQQKAYLYQSTNTSWKSNPFGSATVTKYNADTQQAINPVAGGMLSSSFGPRTSPTAGASSWHKAVDIAAPEGTPVQAVKSGKVTSSGWVNGYGWTVHIDHGDGTETEYHHMQGQSGLQPGDTVEQGQQIGAVGSTGISTGPHLDLQAWKDGKIVDPLTIIPEYGNASGYVYDGTVSAGVVSSRKQESSGKSGSNNRAKSSISMKGFDPFKAFQGF
ncbi:peptidoglycan DD-metalloendopeptidase family protein [Candidatus Agathobaculum pullicola]|uniref:M23 family metallopeptidase n=1 Tax=Candidatus Agathobaculum pullicola TaxID=2838426 RepID=UPI003F8FE8B3